MIRKYLKNKTILSIAGIVIGLILMIWQGQVVEQMIRVVGYILLLAAVVYLIMYFKGNRQNEAQLSYAILAGGAGLLLVILCRLLLHAFPILAGVLMIMSGFASFIQIFYDKSIPLYSKLLSTLIIVLGFLIVIHPGSIANAIVFCIGAAFVVNGISGLVMSRQI